MQCVLRITNSSASAQFFILIQDAARENSLSERKIIVTGGAGFIGANFVHHMVGRGWHVITLNALTYAGNRANLASLDGSSQHTFVQGSITDGALLDTLLAEYSPQAIVNFAAESHVDRSIDGPEDFINTNIVGIYTLLESIRAYYTGNALAVPENAFRFLHISTDEVYGSIETGEFTENSPYSPNSPYAASKASADHLVHAWQKTFGIPAIVTNCTNNYGPFQFPEKLIPLMITKALAETPPANLWERPSGVRDWVHVEDHCRALSMVLADGIPGETYIVGGNASRQNLEVVRKICDILDRLRPRSSGKPYAELIEHVTDRPAHDSRYAVDPAKIQAQIGWQPTYNLSPVSSKPLIGISTIRIGST